MPSILQEFACGNIAPDARYFKRDSEYGRALKALTGCPRPVLRGYIYGYRLDVLVTIDVFAGREGVIADGDA